MTGIGIIGAGHFGAVHARALADVEGVRIAAACRESREGVESFTAEFGGTPYTDWRALLNDKNVDVVLIATPHDMHEAIAIEAAQAGKHIFLEKPMAHTIEACRAINAAVDQNGVKLFVGHIMHFALPCLKAKEVIDSGAIGRPVLGSSWMIKLWMEGNRRPWHLNNDTGGGMLMTAGIHALDRLVWLLGERVSGVSAMIGTHFHEQQADDTALLGLRFANGNAGQVQSIGYRDGAMGFAMELVCERGTIRIDFDTGTWIGRGAKWELIENSIEPNWMHHAVAREWTSFKHSIDTDTPSAIDGAYAQHIIEIIEAAYTADAERREIAI